VQAELVRQIETRADTSFPQLIATSSEDLHKAVVEERFRSDLFYRLQILEVRLPPLRHRMADIPALVSFFLGQLKPGRRISLSKSALDRLFAYDWPGNLRELNNAMAFALTVSAESSMVDVAHLPSYLNLSRQDVREHHLPSPLLAEINAWLDDCFQVGDPPCYRDLEASLEAALVEQLLKRYDGKLAPMAVALQANRSTLRRKLRGGES
jgi:DNA-binding NtrC family response regulator